MYAHKGMAGTACTGLPAKNTFFQALGGLLTIISLAHRSFAGFEGLMPFLQQKKRLTRQRVCTHSHALEAADMLRQVLIAMTARCMCFLPPSTGVTGSACHRVLGLAVSQCTSQTCRQDIVAVLRWMEMMSGHRASLHMTSMGVTC